MIDWINLWYTGPMDGFLDRYEQDLTPDRWIGPTTRLRRLNLAGFENITVSDSQIRMLVHLSKAVGCSRFADSWTEVRSRVNSIGEKLNLDLSEYAEVKGFDLSLCVAASFRPEELFRSLGQMTRRARGYWVHPNEGCRLEYPGGTDTVSFFELPKADDTYRIGIRFLQSEDAKRFSKGQEMLSLAELMKRDKYKQLAQWLGARLHDIERILIPNATIDQLPRSARGLDEWMYSILFQEVVSKQDLEAAIIAAKHRGEISKNAREGMMKKLRKFGTLNGSRRKPARAFFVDNECVREFDTALQKEIERQVSTTEPTELEPF